MNKDVNEVKTVSSRKNEPFSERMQRTFQQATPYAPYFIAAVVVLILGGAGLAIYDAVSHSHEVQAQDQYFRLEKQVSEKKQAFTQAEQQLKDSVKPKPATAKPVKGKPPVAKMEAPVAAPAPESLPSKDLAKDYGTLPQDLKKLIQAQPKTHAAEMAALTLADLQSQYKQNDEALSTLDMVNKQNSAGDYTSALLVNMKGALTSNKGDCKGAVGIWDKILKDDRAKFLHDDVKLRMGLCYEAMQEWDKAEKLYTDVSHEDTRGESGRGDAEAVKEAERSLRLLKIKKMSPEAHRAS